MSKIREQLPDWSPDLPAPEPEGDLKPYVCFTQLSPRKPHVSAGWLDAADDVMAMHFAKQHYGRDQKAVNLWVIPRNAIIGTDGLGEPSADEGPKRIWQAFTQEIDADTWAAGERVEATSSFQALERAKATVENLDALHSIWVVPTEKIIATEKDELVWRHTDQSYRLARGYSKRVRTLWDQLREKSDVDEYEKDDLEEAF